MDPELKAELERLGVLPEEMYDLPEGVEVHRSPGNLPPYISQRLDRIEENASAMHRMETEGKASSADYEALETAVRKNLAELAPFREGNFWAIPQRMIDEGEAYDPAKEPAVTGVDGVSRDFVPPFPVYEDNAGAVILGFKSETHNRPLRQGINGINRDPMGGPYFERPRIGEVHRRPRTIDPFGKGQDQKSP